MLKNKTDTPDKYYEKGLKFKCIGCGSCCTGAPGFVYLSEKEIYDISRYLGISEILFIKQYTNVVRIFGEKRLSLREKSNYDCILLKDNRCSIYPVRPYQCRSYPFWKNNVESEKQWNRVAKECPGVNKGILYTKYEIESIINGIPDYNIKNFRIVIDAEI